MEPFSMKWYLAILEMNNMLMIHKAGHFYDYIIGAIMTDPKYINEQVNRRYELSQYIIERMDRKL